MCVCLHACVYSHLHFLRSICVYVSAVHMHILYVMIFNIQRKTCGVYWRSWVRPILTSSLHRHWNSSPNAPWSNHRKMKCDIPWSVDLLTEMLSQWRWSPAVSNLRGTKSSRDGWTGSFVRTGMFLWVFDSLVTRICTWKLLRYPDSSVKEQGSMLTTLWLQRLSLEAWGEHVTGGVAPSLHPFGCADIQRHKRRDESLAPHCVTQSKDKNRKKKHTSCSYHVQPHEASVSSGT